MKLEFLQLAEFIRNKAEGEAISLLINPGNWGDALIRFGTERFLDSFNIPFRRIYLDESLLSRLSVYRAGIKGGLLLCTGGGAWCNHYNHLSSTLENLMRRWRFRHLIVLPSTYENPYNLPHTTFFRRDNGLSAEAMPEAKFCHDLAFFIGSLRTAPPALNTAYCFRTDAESSGAHHIPPDNVDLSAQGTERDDVGPFFAYLARYQRIYTDRLHIAIGAALLGREVHVFPGRYPKSKAIYHASLEPYYANVHWHDRFNANTYT